jgi:hypothetical protein
MSEIAPESDISRHGKIDVNDLNRTCWGGRDPMSGAFGWFAICLLALRWV